MFAARFVATAPDIAKTITFRQYIGNTDERISARAYLSGQEEKSMDIRNTSVLITGGSRGLGFALGKTLAAGGARVVLVARGGAELNAAVDEICAAGG